MEQIGIEFKLTDACNQWCSHCVNSDSPDKVELADAALFCRRVREFARGPVNGFTVKAVRITGGEPLLFPDEVKTIASDCRSLGIACGVNTNAVLLTEVMAKELKASGLGLVKISLDATDSDVLRSFRGNETSVDRVCGAIENAKQAGMQIIIRFTLTRITADYLIPCFQLARRYGVSLFQVKPLIASGRAVNSDLFLSAAAINERLEALQRHAEGGRTRVLILCWPSVLSGGLESQTCGSSDKIYVDTRLDVFVCNYVQNPSRLGDLRQGSLREIFMKRKEQLAVTPGGEPIVRGCPQMVFFGEE